MIATLIMQPKLGEHDSRALITESVKWQIIGIVLMICHVLLVKLSLVFYPLIMLAIGWLYTRASLAAILIFFQILLYQNVIISIFDADMDFTTFQALQGTNFVVLFVLGIVAGIRLLPIRQHYEVIFKSIVIALSAAVIYTLFGIVKGGLTPALVYFRFFTGAIFAGLIGLDVGRVWSFRTIGFCFLYSSVLSIILSIVEYCFPIEYYDLINCVRFYQLKYNNAPKGNTFFTPQDIVNQFTTVFLNLSNSAHGEYGFDNFRFGGTIINPISNGYIMSVLAITAVALKRSLWLLILVPLIIMAGTKGASILLITTLMIYWIWLVVRNRYILLICGLCLTMVYVSGGIISGLHNDDYHVLGFIGGVRSLLHNPIGHGMGVGGNMSQKAENTKMDNERSTLKSADFDFALESAMGVMFYQMGLASATILGVFAAFVWTAPLGLSARYALPKRSDMVYFALAMIVINGIFQEEAYAPYASGLIMLLASVLIGNQRQIAQVVIPGLASRASREPKRPMPFAKIGACLFCLFATGAEAVPADRLQSLERGVNISTSFEDGRDLDLEIRQIAEVGFSHVRVFVMLESLNDPVYVGRIERLVQETTERRMGIILCMTTNKYRWRNGADVKAIWIAAWSGLAEKLRASSPRYVYLELANEPSLTDSAVWDGVQSELRRVVRHILPEHTIVLCGSPDSGVWSLVAQPSDVSQDDNIVYAVHLYQPMAVTCQGCDCCPPDKPLRGLDYPPNEANIRRLTTPATSAILADYRQHGAKMLAAEIADAASWAAAHHVPVIADEFGIFSAASVSTRAAWLGEARRRLEEAKIGWTVWEWKGGFGVAPLLPKAPLTLALGMDRYR